jgi:membrane protease YdiL (CAAX protease family)
MLDAASYAQVLSLHWGTRWQLLGGALAGIGLGLGFLALIKVVAFQPTQAPSLVAQAAVTPGSTQWAWIISALLLAPPIEEVLFRGVLFGGLAKTWSLPAAAFVSGSVFWLMHAPEWLRYWPAAVAIALLTIALTVLRIRSRSVGPCIAAHFGYNLVLALAVFGWSAQAA